MGTRAIAFAAVVLAAAPACAESPLLEGGSYAVTVRLELPHLEDMTQTSTRTLCLTAEPGANNHGLTVLSENNPLARCPVSDLREAGADLTFAIACEGRNAAKASARYVLAPQGFRGRIVMQMGGKNMTMTEVQEGKRVGACEGGAPTQ